MSWYEEHARNMEESGEWTEEEARDYVENMMYAEWKDEQAWREQQELPRS